MAENILPFPRSEPRLPNLAEITSAAKYVVSEEIPDPVAAERYLHLVRMAADYVQAFLELPLEEIHVQDLMDLDAAAVARILPASALRGSRQQCQYSIKKLQQHARTLTRTGYATAFAACGSSKAATERRAFSAGRRRNRGIPAQMSRGLVYYLRFPARIRSRVILLDRIV